MTGRLLTLAVLIGLGAVVGAQSSMPPAAYYSAADIAGMIRETTGDSPGMAAARMERTDDYRINMIHRDTSAGAIVHEVGNEVHYITSGTGTLVTGGVVVRSSDGARTVDGGLARQVSVGDVIFIPEGTPHWYSNVPDHVDYLEIRF